MLHLGPVVGSVVSCTDAVAKLLLRDRAFPREGEGSTSPQVTHRVHNRSAAAYGLSVDSTCTQVLSEAMYASNDSQTTDFFQNADL